MSAETKCADCTYLESRGYAMTKRLADGVGVDEAVEKVIAAMKAQKFGLPPGTTNMKAGEIMVAKGLSTELKKFRMLGFCSPPEAHTVMTTEPILALFLPCSCIVVETPAGHTEIAIIDPLAMMGFSTKKDELMEVVTNVRSRLQAALQAV